MNEQVARARNHVNKTMTMEQLLEAEQRAAEWMKKQESFHLLRLTMLANTNRTQALMCRLPEAVEPDYAVGRATERTIRNYFVSVRPYGVVVISPMFATVSPFFMEGTPHM